MVRGRCAAGAGRWLPRIAAATTRHTKRAIRLLRVRVAVSMAAHSPRAFAARPQPGRSPLECDAGHRNPCVASVPGGAVVRFAAMEFLILGPLEVADDGQKLALGGPKQRAVLAHLILRANQVVPADLLIDGLWGEEPPESARNTLQTYVYRLRKLLGEGRIEGRDGGYVLAAAPEEIDAARFEALVKQGKAEVASDPAAAAATLSDALSLWRADALADVSEEPSLRGEAARLEELRLSATEHRITAEIAVGRPLHGRLRARGAHRPLSAARTDVGEPDARPLPVRPTGGGAVDVRAGPAGARRRARRRSVARAAAPARADPATERPRSSDPSPRRPRLRPSRVDLQPGTEVAGYRIEAHARSRRHERRLPRRARLAPAQGRAQGPGARSSPRTSASGSGSSASPGSPHRSTTRT